MEEFSILKPMHPSRVKIMDVLMHYPNATYRHLAHELGGVSNAVVRHHLGILIAKGLLEKISMNAKRNKYKILGYSNPPMESYYKQEKDDA